MSTLTRIIPTRLAFLAILLIGYFVVKAIAKVVSSLLERVGFDRAVERGGVKQALVRTEYDASDIVAKPVFAPGGGGIQPTRERWEQSLRRYDVEKHQVRAELERNRAHSPQASQRSSVPAEDHGGRTVRLTEFVDTASR